MAGPAGRVPWTQGAFAVEARPELPGSAGAPIVAELPPSYVYGVTRYADVIISQAFPHHWSDLTDALSTLAIDRSELEAGGGNRSTIAERFDTSLQIRGWGKRSVTIEKRIDGEPVMAVRGHEIDMFKAGHGGDIYPGVGCELEWNNKDPFFDRDLNNFAALHREGVIAAGVIVTRGPGLQERLRAEIPGGASKYGASTTWWDKLIPRVNLGGGGECPLLLVGIEPGRIRGLEGVQPP